MSVEVAQQGAGKKMPAGKLKKTAQSILALVGQADAELSLVLVGNAEMRKLNSRYRRKDYPTDVLSFPIEDDSAGPDRLLGDVVISIEKADEQAKQRGRTRNEEIVTLLIHGVVHLLGYDHERSAKDARTMKRLENKIYRQLCEQGLINV
ncbi:MAG TPA: rRNA maturation RNase YbeY [Candidatus Binatia bacterium]|nr:rRNA maturation RNase YbeY [Candidatus Binatia bacterium]